MRDHKADIWIIDNNVNWSDSERKTENEIRHNWSGFTKGERDLLISIAASHPRNSSLYRMARKKQPQSDFSKCKFTLVIFSTILPQDIFHTLVILFLLLLKFSSTLALSPNAQIPYALSRR